MTRLTEKTTPNPIHDCGYVAKVEEKGLLDKLGQIEDIEEELGVDLVTLFKALKGGAWFKLEGFKGIRKQDEIMFIKAVSIGPLLQLCGRYEYDGKHRYVCDLSSQYGKTWALTKEELL